MANTILYGFHGLKDVFAERVTEVGVNVVQTAIQETVNAHREMVSKLYSLFATTTREFKTRYKTPNSGALQPLDPETGRARKIQVGGYYDVGFPIHSAGIAWGRNRMTSLYMTVEETNRVMATILDADVRWMRNHLLAALFNNASYTFSDKEHGDLTVLPLANGDAVTYLRRNGNGVPATDSHFFAQADAIADATNPYTAAATDLREHPENDGDVIHLIPTNLVDTTKALAGFLDRPDPNVRLADTVNVLTALLGTNEWGLSGSIPGQLLGYDEASRSWIFEWPVLPDSYVISTMTGAEKPLAMREYDIPELQGFHVAGERADYPYWEQQFEHHLGFGSWNRVGAVITRIGNAAYAVPAGYETPMA